MQYKETATVQKQLLLSIIIVGLLWIMNELLYSTVWATQVSVVVLILLGLSNIITIYYKHRLLVTPLSIFSVIWLIIIPLCSSEYPMMEKMTQFQWRWCLLGCMMFFVGGLLSNSYAKKHIKDRSQNVAEWKMSQLLYWVCISLLFTCICLYLINAALVGGFPIFVKNMDHSNFYLPGFSFFCNIGVIAIYLVFCDKYYRKRKLFLLLTACYLIVLFLMTVRFMIILLIIMIMSTFSLNVERKKQLLKIAAIMCIIVLIFVGVTNFRGGKEDKETFFVASGLYSGSADSLVATEIVRYFGMSQRTMESYMQNYKPGCTYLCLTLSPVFDLLGVEYYNPRRYGIYGYTATNIITNFYFDAGYAWWLLMIGWAFVVNTMYYRCKNQPNSILRKYLWCVSAISITMSFYCYINSYTYWCLHFVIILILLKGLRGRIIFGKRRKV